MSTKIDRVKQVLALRVEDDTEAVCMVLSGHTTHGSPDGALIHVSAFEDVAKDIIKYLKLTSNPS